MKTPSVAPVTDTPSDAATWRNLAVSRTAGPARKNAEARVQAFIDAGLELLGDPDAGEITVQNVVDRSGLSLRSFYQHFEGKYELLLAVFEESVRVTAFHLTEQISAVETPLERLEVFVTEYYRICRSQTPRGSDQRLPGRAVGQFAYQLLFEHPQEASHAFTPLVTSLQGLLEDAAAAGGIQAGRDFEQVAGIILQAIMFNAFSSTITGATTDDVAGRGDLFWEVLLHGLAGAG
jgi:AcrR family transcriptional regulator